VLVHYYEIKLYPSSHLPNIVQTLSEISHILRSSYVAVALISLLRTTLPSGDWCRNYSARCDGCGDSVTSDDLVHQVGNSSIYHVRCFTCIHCQRRLSSRALYVTDNDRRIVCKDCCLAGISTANNRLITAHHHSCSRRTHLQGGPMPVIPYVCPVHTPNSKTKNTEQKKLA